MELLYFIWHHCNLCDIVISLWLTPSLQYAGYVLVRQLIVATQRTHLYDVALLILPKPGIVHASMVLYPSAGMDS